MRCEKLRRFALQQFYLFNDNAHSDFENVLQTAMDVLTFVNMSFPALRELSLGMDIPVSLIRFSDSMAYLYSVSLREHLGQTELRSVDINPSPASDRS